MIKRIAKIHKIAEGLYEVAHFTFQNGKTVEHGIETFQTCSDAREYRRAYLCLDD